MTNENAEIAAFVITWLLMGFILFGYTVYQTYKKRMDHWSDSWFFFMWVVISVAFLTLILFIVTKTLIYYLLT